MPFKINEVVEYAFSGHSTPNFIPAQDVKIVALDHQDGKLVRVRITAVVDDTPEEDSLTNYVLPLNTRNQIWVDVNRIRKAWWL